MFSFISISKGKIIRVVVLASIAIIVFLFACCQTTFAIEMTVDTDITSNSKSAVLVEANSLQALISHKADERQNIAGLTKLPALLVVCEAVDNGKLDIASSVSISEKAAKVSGPTAFIEAGETIDAKSLMKAACMIGAGDAVMALGEHIFGSENVFIGEIDSRLDELGIEITLSDALGLGVQLSANELAKLGAALMQSGCFSEHAKLVLEYITHSDGRTTELSNPNRMLRNYAGCGGVMTGSSTADGYTGVFSITKGDTHFIAAVIGCQNSSIRFETATAMYNQGFAAIRVQRLASKGDVISKGIRVKGSRIRDVNLVAKDTVVVLLDKNAPPLEGIEDIPTELKAPLNSNNVVGAVCYRNSEGEEVGRVELVPQYDIDASSFRGIVSLLLLEFLRL